MESQGNKAWTTQFKCSCLCFMFVCFVLFCYLACPFVSMVLGPFVIKGQEHSEVRGI